MSESLPVRMVHHVGRLTKKLSESRAFYREVLGFQEIPRPNFDFQGAWLFNYGLQIHLIENRSIGDGDAAIQTRDNHIALEVDDLDQAERILAERGIPHRVNFQADTGRKQIFFHDPDGHTIEIGSYGKTLTFDMLAERGA